MLQNLSTKDDIIFLQRLLRLGGFNPGVIDGIKGRRTNAALDAWNAAAAAYKAKYGTFDERTEKNLATLLPGVQARARYWLGMGVKKYEEITGFDVKIICGTRTFAEQNELYAQGRTKAGDRVTKAKGGYSWHNFGVAFDVGIFDKKGGYIKRDFEYKMLNEIAGNPEGFTWGGNWTSLYDTPHYQFNIFKTTAELRKEFTK